MTTCIFFYLIYIIITVVFFFNKPSLFTVGFCAGLILFFIALFWFIFGKDRHITSVVNFYPPKNLNAAEVGVVYSEKITKNNFCAFFMQLEQEGYIKTSSYKDKEMKVDKLKEYKGSDKNIKQYMKDLEYDNRIVDPKDILDYCSSKRRIAETNCYKNLKKFKDRLYDEMSTSADIIAPCVISFLLLVNLTVYSLFEQSGKILNFLNFFSIILIPFIIKGIKRKNMVRSIINFAFAILVAIVSIINHFQENIETTGMYTVGETIFSIILLLLCIIYNCKEDPDKKIHYRKWRRSGGGIEIPYTNTIARIIISIVLAVILCAYSVLFFSTNPPNVLFHFLFLLFCITISLICLYNMPQKNDITQRLKGEVLGFRKFLLTVEKPILEKLLKEDKDYCNKMLPYAYSLMIADKWIEKVKNLVNINVKNYNITIDMVCRDETEMLFF